MRKRKKMTRIDKLNYIQRLALEVSGVGLLEREPNRPHVFTEWSAHVDWLEVRVFLQGWKEYKGPDFVVRLDNGKQILERFDDKRQELVEAVYSDWDERSYRETVTLLERLKKEWC